MNKIVVGLLAVLSLGLAGFTGCHGEKSAAPEADNKAWCKTNYTTADACNADVKCAWKPAEPAKNKPEHCGDK